MLATIRGTSVLFREVMIYFFIFIQRSDVCCLHLGGCALATAVIALLNLQESFRLTDSIQGTSTLGDEVRILAKLRCNLVTMMNLLMEAYMSLQFLYLY